MTRLDVHDETTVPTETPTRSVIEAANRAVTMTGAGGRLYRLRQPTPLQQFRIVEALGDTAANAVYMGMLAPLLCVAEIDGEPVSFPTTKRQVEALIQRVGEDYESLAKAAADAFGEAETADEQRERIKN